VSGAVEGVLAKITIENIVQRLQPCPPARRRRARV
jgi:hypothetical protein